MAGGREDWVGWLELKTERVNEIATQNTARVIKEVNADVESMGVKVLQQYALLGPYDFLNILEAPDELTMARVATTLAARGTLKTLTINAIEVDDFIASLGAGTG